MTNNGFIHLRLYHRVEAGRSTRKEDKRGRRSSSYIAIEGTSSGGISIVSETRPKGVYADLALVNGRVITMNRGQSEAEAVAVKDGTIVMVGSDEEIEGTVGAETVKVDLNGMTVLPGFIDAHNHLAISATDSTGVDCTPEAVGSISEMMEKIAQVAREKPKDVWIRGVNYDDARLREKRHPTKWDIDKQVSDHPVVLIHRGYHIAVVNSAGMRRLGITEDAEAPFGGEYGREAETGELNGILYENAWFNLWGTDKSPLAVEEEAFIAGVEAICTRYVKAGITSINDAWVLPSNFRGFQEALTRGKLPIRVNIHLIHTCLDELEQLGLKRGFGNNRLKIMAVKLILDGSVSGLTAALYDPYVGRPDDRGILLMDEKALKEMITRIHTAGFQVSVHANGDKAIDLVLDAFEAALEQAPQENHRHRIEHCSLLSPERVARIKTLGLVPVIFAAYPYYHGDKILPAFGPARVKWLMACRALIDAGVRIAGHSDYPASPYNPLLGIHSLVNRVTERGQPFSREQAITVEEALRMYTIDAAYASFDEGIKGSIEPRKLADFVIVRENPLEVAKGNLKDIKVAMTIVGGELVYKSP
jgi:predicted amidohydrolase YtcJ